TAGLTRSFRAGSLSLGVLCLATLAVHAETPLERGTYLMQSIVACGNCHTPKDRDGKPMADRELAGGFVINAPIFHSVSPNITPDKETGIGNWTDDQIVDAIRNGKRRTARSLVHPCQLSTIATCRIATRARLSRICAQSSRSRTRPRSRLTKSPCQLSTGPRSPACPICRAPTKSHTADTSRRHLDIAWTATHRWSMAAAT